MTQGKAFLKMEAEWWLGLTNKTAILCNVPSIGVEDEALILANEPIQVADGYAPVAIYAGTVSDWIGDYDATAGYWRLADLTVSFTQASTEAPYQINNLVIWQGRGTAANKPITAVDTAANTVTCLSHGLSNGQRSFVASTGTLPGGLATQRYYSEVVDANTVRFHTNSALTSAVDITSAGAGSLRLVYAEGQFVESIDVGLTTINPAPAAAKYFKIEGTRKYA